MTRHSFETLDAFRRRGRAALGKGPIALVLAEDEVELASTLDHLAGQGFRNRVCCLPPDLAPPVPPARDAAIPPARTRPPIVDVTIRMDVRAPDALQRVVNTAIEVADPGTWLHACYNAEYLFFPFCESRSIGEMLAFHAEERRAAMLTLVVDLYAADLSRHPDGVDRGTAHLDRIGYYALPRRRPGAAHGPQERQLDFFGALRWRHESHVEPARRRIDRIGLFRARPGLRLRADGTFDDEELNTYACPWHNNLTAAICSFRAAKALRHNPLSRDAIDTFLWPGALRFDWTSRQLMSLGLIEPGQWF